MFVWRSVEVINPDSGEAQAAHAMVPMPRFAQLADRQFAADEPYALGPVENVAHGSRGQFFAQVREVWSNLPEDDARFPSQEHLRHRALVAAGWATHSQTVFDTPGDAKKFVAGLRRVEEYAVISVSRNVVDVWVSRSIAGGQITADQWREVKPKAEAWLAEQANITRRELERHSRDGGAR